MAKFLRLLPVILAIITFGIEVTRSRPYVTAKKIEKDSIPLTLLDEFDPHLHSIASINSSRIEFPRLKDKLFNITRTTPVLIRDVQYCEESNSFLSNFDIYFNGLPIGRPKWVSLRGQKFPPKHPMSRFEGIKTTKQSEDAKFGIYTIDKNIFERSKDQFKVLTPTADEKWFIETQIMDRTFAYLSNGWFYATDGNARRKFDNFRSIRPSKRVNFMHFGGDILTTLISLVIQALMGLTDKFSDWNPYDDFFDNCNDGDVRMQFRYLEPGMMTVVGYVNRTKVGIGSSRGVSIGRAMNGKHTPSELMIEEADSLESFSSGMKIICMIAILIGVHKSSQWDRVRIARTVMIALCVLFLRSIIWQWGNLWYIVFSLALVAYLPLYMKLKQGPNL